MNAGELEVTADVRITFALVELDDGGRVTVACRRDGGGVTVAPKRVLVTGVGGELGTRVASLLEELPWVEDVIGVDIDPPRGRLRRTTFQRIDPRDRRRTVELVSSLRPPRRAPPRRLRAERQGHAR